jgi:hypothetical protein
MTERQGEKLEEFIRIKNISITDLAPKLNVSRGTIYLWFTKKELSKKVQDLLRNEIGFRVQSNVNSVSSGSSEPTEQKTEQKQTKSFPLFEIDVSAGDINMFQDNPEIPTTQISIPGFEDCDFGTYVWGHSMYNTYENGTIIACKRINDKEIIQFGEAYLIVTEEQRMIKRIQKSDNKNCILATSDNDSKTSDGKRQFESFDIPKNKIRFLYIVKGCIKRNQI